MYQVQSYTFNGVEGGGGGKHTKEAKIKGSSTRRKITFHRV